MVKVSIIVPVYNVERFLRECVFSIVGQTLKDIEIIIMDDGSTDGSKEIVDEFAREDSRIVAVHKENEGYGKTLNRALDLATGEYIGIVESDDYIELNMFEKLYSIAVSNINGKYDVVKASYASFSSVDDNTPVKLFADEITGHSVCARNSEHNEVALFAMQACIWSAIYKHSFLRDNDIRFLETPGASFQDTAFNFKVLALANKIYLSNEPLYHYRQHAGQSVKSNAKMYCVCDEWDEIEHFMDRYPDWKKTSAKLRNILRFYAYYWNYKRLAPALRSKFKERFIKEFRELIRKGEFTPNLILSKKIRYWFCLALNPDDYFTLFKKHIYNIQKVIWRARIKNNTISYYTLLGKIKLYQAEFKDNRIWPKF